MKKVRAVLAYVNGSSTDSNVVELACDIGKRSHCRVHVIYVIQVRRELPLTAEIQPEMDKGERVLEAAERVSEGVSYQIETEILQAREIGPAVVDEAVERSCDLIVLGVPFQMRMGSFEVGAAADYVLKSAPAWVWLVRGPMGEQS
jgi:nucleotide-binding universal stress UspA family protein